MGPPSEGRGAIPTSQEMHVHVDAPFFHLLNVPPTPPGVAWTISNFSEDIRQPHVHPHWIRMGNGWWARWSASWAYQCPFSRSRACERFFLLGPQFDQADDQHLGRSGRHTKLLLNTGVRRHLQSTATPFNQNFVPHNPFKSRSFIIGSVAI